MKMIHKPTIRKAAATRRYNLKQYGLTVEHYEELLTIQNHRCAICRKRFKGDARDITAACVDHNHTTGATRGLLCGHCNRGIGHLQDDVTILENAIKYLKALDHE